jgi:hypothetical protein
MTVEDDLREAIDGTDTAMDRIIAKNILGALKLGRKLNEAVSNGNSGVTLETELVRLSSSSPAAPHFARVLSSLRAGCGLREHFAESLLGVAPTTSRNKKKRDKKKAKKIAEAFATAVALKRTPYEPPPEDGNYLKLSAAARELAYENTCRAASVQISAAVSSTTAACEQRETPQPPTLQSIDALLAAVEVGLSGDPVFARVREVVRQVRVAVSAGHDVHHIIPGDLDAGPGSEGGLFEPLPCNSTVAEALEYVARSARPSTARRVIMALRALRRDA